MRHAEAEDRRAVVVIYNAMPYLLAAAPFVIAGIARLIG